MRISDWSSDVCSSDLEQMQRDFATGVQILSGPDGLSPEALNAMFSLEQPLEKAIAIAGAVERQGGAFKDQQFAVKNFMVRWWSELSPRSEEHTSELQSLMRISYAVFCLKKKNKEQRANKI